MKARNKRYAAILSVVTVLALALSLVAVPTPTFAATAAKPSAFADVKATDPYANAFNALAAVGVYQGDQNGNANPTQPITRAEFAAVAVRLAGKAAVANSLQSQTPAFKDASQIPSWAWGSVNAANALGIIKGYPDGTFRASNNVTEAEAAAMIIRVLGNDGAAQTGLWPANYMSVAQGLGLLNGISNASANVPATRADVAFMAYNALLATQKWDAATNSFDKDFAGLPIYYTNPTTGQPQQRTGSQLTSYGEAQGVMTEVGSFSSSSVTLADTVYATSGDLSSLQNQDVYAFRPFGATAYSALVLSGNTSVASGTVTGLSANYISVGGKLYPLSSSGVSYTVNGTLLTSSSQLPSDFVSSGAYSVTLTLDSNGYVTAVSATRYNVSGFLTKAMPASTSPDTLDEIQVSAFNSGYSGTYDVTSASILVNGQPGAIADVQKALSDFASAHGGQPISVKIATPYDPSSKSFITGAPGKSGTALAVKVSSQTASGQVTSLGRDSSGPYIVLSGQSNPTYLGGNLALADFTVGATVTVLLDASGNAVLVLTNTAQTTDFYAMLNKVNTAAGSTGGNVSTITVTLGDGSTQTYTLNTGVTVDQDLLGKPVYVTIDPSTGYVDSVQSYTAGPEVTGMVKSVSASYLSLEDGSIYTFAGTPLVFDATDTNFANQLPVASLVSGTQVELYLNSLNQVAVVILPAPAAQVSSISVSATSLTLTAGQTQQLKVTANLADGTTQDVTSLAQYSSSNTSVATVSASGLVTAKNPGTATITVSYGGKSATVAVTVPAPAPTAVSGIGNGSNQINITFNEPIQLVAPITGVVLVDQSNAALTLQVFRGSVSGSTLTIQYDVKGGTVSNGDQVLVQLPAGLVSGAGGTNAAQSLTVTVYITAPTVQTATASVVTTNGTYVNAAGAPKAQWTVQVKAGDLPVASVELQAIDTNNTLHTFAVLTPDSTGKATFTGFGTLPDGSYTDVQAVAIDQAGNKSSAKEVTVNGNTPPFNFALDTTAPAVSSVKLHSQGSQLVIDFSEQLGVTSGAAASTLLKELNLVVASVPVDLTASGVTATWGTTTDQNGNTVSELTIQLPGTYAVGSSFTLSYTAPVPADLADLAGNPLAGFTVTGTVEP